MSKRTSYPAAENLEHAIQVLELTKKSPFPKSLVSNLTKKHQGRFPILYDIMKKRHVTSDYLQLLEMIGLCEVTERTEQWYVFEFSEFLQNFTDFPQEDVQTEILDTIKEFKIRDKIETYKAKQEALDLIQKEKQKLQFLLSFFYRFFRLDPPYFRYLIQHSSILDISSTKKSDLQNRFFLIVREKFPKFVKDDAVRILRWAEYFRVLERKGTERKGTYYFSIETIVQYVGHALASYLNEKRQGGRTHFVWQELESDLNQDLFYPESFLRPETLLELLLDQNLRKIRWGTIERGPSRYKGFRRNPARQFLEIRETPIEYTYLSEHVSRVVKR